MYFLQIPSTHAATNVNNEHNNGAVGQQYLIPVLQSLETESQLQLILDVNIESPVFEELFRSTKSCQTLGLPQVQELNLEAINSLLIKASDLKLISSKELSKESSDDIIKDQEEKTNETEIPKKCVGSKYISVYDSNVIPRAMMSLPSPLLLRKDVIISRRTIPSCCKFGPVKGLKNIMSNDKAKELLLKSGQNNRPVYLIKNEESIIHVDVSDQDKSNWFSLLALGNMEDANLWLKQEDGELYAITVKSIPPRTKIKIGYSLEFLSSYGKFEGLPVVDFDIVSPAKSYQTWLYEKCDCSNSYDTRCNKKDITSRSRSKRAPYKCKLCGSRFVRRYTLKRHIRTYCSKNIDTLTISSEKDPAPMPPLSQAAPSTDDSKLPSDDSFNHYSSLDFPTSLFDPERISNLDLSVRSDEFGLCAIGGRDDNCLNDALANNDPKFDVLNLKKQLLSSCTDCGQIIVTEKHKSHQRLCPAKQFKCECGAKFMSQKLLDTHKNADHKIESNQERSYVCKECNISFKRRGMLVNHKHNLHGSIVSPSLYKCIVQYRCPSCPNTYSTVAKRKRHVEKHHPGVDPKDGETIRSGSSKRFAVKCVDVDCHRQYGTRAKMLQHWRSCHADTQDSSPRNEQTTNTINN